MTTYVCSGCGKPVEVKDGAVIRPCKCDAPVIANLKARATGESRAASC
jgi:DNA-directed RNA polymerase subunit RPC12/RpoP